MKPYFTKYLPVKDHEQSDRWQYNNTIKNTGWENISPSDMDAIIAHGLHPAPEFRKVKLFLCSRDIKVGDRFFTQSEEFECQSISEKKHGIGHFVHYDDNQVINSSLCYKVIGEISKDATWVKEGDEFDEENIVVYHDGGNFYCKIKGPCGHFH